MYQFLVMMMFCMSSDALMGQAAMDRVFFEGKVCEESLDQSFFAFNPQESFEDFVKDFKIQLHNVDEIQSEVSEIWSVFFEKRNEWFSKERLEKLSFFVREGGFPLDFYEIHMMQTIDDFLQRHHQSVSNVEWVIGSTRTESWQKIPLVKKSLANRFQTVQIDESIFQSYKTAVALSYGSDSSEVFERWMKTLGHHVTLSDHGLVWSNNPLFEQKIMSDLATIDVSRQWGKSLESLLVASLYQMICTQVLMAREFHDFDSVVEMAGRRLPLIVTLFVQNAWVEYLTEFPEKRSPYLVSSLALKAFRVWNKDLENNEKVWKNIGTFGHKGVSFFESYARQTAVHYAAEEKDLPVVLNKLIQKEGLDSFVFSASLAGELLAFLLQSQASQMPVALPDLLGVESGFSLLTSYRSHPRHLCVRQDSELEKTLELVEPVLGGSVNSEECRVSGLIFSEISKLKDLFHLRGYVKNFPDGIQKSIGMGGAFFRFFGAPKTRSNAVKLMQLKFDEFQNLNVKTHAECFSWQDCCKWTGDGKASGNHLKHLSAGQRFEDIHEAVRVFAEGRKNWLNTHSAHEKHEILQTWLALLDPELFKDPS
ncbi:MAG: hypothetical protein AB8C84_10475 [Oligoflexales bacterium]